jgi:hypothetical protein
MSDATEKLPPVVYGNPLIDALNARLWSLPVPEYSAQIQRMQMEVIEIERTLERDKWAQSEKEVQDGQDQKGR